MEATPNPETVEQVLNALAADLVNAPTFKFRKREYGGYFVEYRGLTLGWVVRPYGESTWNAYAVQDDRVRQLDHGAPTRQYAADFLATMVARQTGVRINFEIAMERRFLDEQRITRLLAD